MFSKQGSDFTGILEDGEKKLLKKYALISSERREKTVHPFRDYSNDPLEYRTEYHRDRDRIVWSSAFKRMQHKTQVFPYYVADHYRRRLTHSIEVSQIATTLARGLCINETATEAIALGHDLGHTPFGHGGEEALNKATMAEIEDGVNPYDFSVPVFGFNHCLQGIECVSRIENPYWQNGKGFPGLNLSYDVREGILKHIKKRDEAPKQKEKGYPEEPFSSLKDIIKLKEYKIFGSDFGSLEAQCVSIADKLAYLISDLQDALHCHIFETKDLYKHNFFVLTGKKHNEYRGTSKVPKTGTNDEFFLYLQNFILPTLILNIFESTIERIGDARIESFEDIKNHKYRLVVCSDDLWGKWQEFQEEFMQNKFYHNDSVEVCDYKAKKIVKDLFEAYYSDDKLVAEDYRKYMEKVYENKVDKKYLKLITAKNYVAGMTDSYALEQHSRLFMSSVKATSF